MAHASRPRREQPDPVPIPGVRRERWAQFASRAFRPVAIIVPLVVLGLGAAASEFLGGLAWAGIIWAGFAIRAFRAAPGRAREAFYTSYAEARGLELSRDETAPGFTPLLSQGDAGYIDYLMVGTLPGDLPAFLGLYSFEDHSYSSDGDLKVKRYPFTIVVHELSAVSPRLSELYCMPRQGYRFTDAIRERRTGLKRLETESEALDKRYEIFYSPDDDDVWLRRVFIPSFIVWVEAEPPPGFYFEVLGEYICAYVRGHYENADQLDSLCMAAANVVDRLVGEAAESLTARQ